MERRRVDRLFLWIVAILVFIGFLIFSSASLGLFARKGADFTDATSRQLLYGVMLGIVGCAIAARIDYHRFRKWSFFLFVIAIAATALVFVPGIGMRSGGATRWIAFDSYTFQPSEFLKFAFVCYLAALLAQSKRGIKSFKRGFLPLALVLGTVTALLLKQPDTGTLAVFFIAALSMFVVSGGLWRHIFLVGVISAAGLAALAFTRPYVLDRLTTFVNPSHDALGASYQLRQALIAVGSGQLLGRGFGKSIQKFNFLPEPTGDSIFAVAAEEFGFIGSSIIVALFLAFGLRGMRIAARAPDSYGRLLATGFVMMIVGQSFVNIAAMLGLIPLTGVPLLFVSHGGSALLFALIEVGVVLGVSKHA